MQCSFYSNHLFYLQKLKVQAWDRKMHGKFCMVDAYIVLLVKLSAELTHCFLVYDALGCGSYISELDSALYCLSYFSCL